MKSLTLILALTVLIYPSSFATETVFHGHSTHHYSHSDIDCHNDGISYHIDDGTIVITHDGADFCEIEITEECELYIDGDLIKTNAEGKRLLQEYYDQASELTDAAVRIGLEGAKIGADGAILGIQAVASVAKLLRSDYDTDDLEREMEMKSAKIEAKAERLEEKAEAIEDSAEELEELSDQLKDEIPELEELEWF